MAMTKEQKRLRDNAYQRKRYATDPVYRAKKQASCRVINFNRYHNDSGFREAQLAEKRKRWATIPEVREANEKDKAKSKKNDPVLFALRQRAIDANNKAKRQDVPGRIDVNDIMSHLTRVVSEKGRLECEYCHKKVELLGGKGISFEIDHVKTMSKGGHNTRENLKICCCKCNQKKKDRPVEEFLAKLNRKVTDEEYIEAALRITGSG